jgi:hypothetical protein
MPVKAVKISVSAKSDILEEIFSIRTAAVRLVHSARAVLLSIAKYNNEQVGETVGLNPQQAPATMTKIVSLAMLASVERLLRLGI